MKKFPPKPRKPRTALEKARAEIVMLTGEVALWKERTQDEKDTAQREYARLQKRLDDKDAILLDRDATILNINRGIDHAVDALEETNTRPRGGCHSDSSDYFRGHLLGPREDQLPEIKVPNPAELHRAIGLAVGHLKSVRRV